MVNLSSQSTAATIDNFSKHCSLFTPLVFSNSAYDNAGISVKHRKVPIQELKKCDLCSDVMSWIVSPLFSMIIGYVLIKFIMRRVLSHSNAATSALRWPPIFIGSTCFEVVLSFLYKTPLGKKLSLGTPAALITATLVAVGIGFFGRWFLEKIVVRKKITEAEDVFRFIQNGTACYVALAQGANDVANAIGPLALIYFLVQTGSVGNTVPVPIFLLLFGGLGIASGIWMAGHRVMDTMGTKITTLTNTRGFSVVFASATTVLVASKLGLPVSTTHAAVGGVMGVGLARGIEAVNFRIVFQIMIYWILTVPAAAITSILIICFLNLLWQ
jgi:PiT family inorganic phosphate transporter